MTADQYREQISQTFEPRAMAQLWEQIKSCGEELARRLRPHFEARCKVLWAKKPATRKPTPHADVVPPKLLALIRKITARQAAPLLGLSQSHLSRIRKQHAKCPAAALERLNRIDIASVARIPRRPWGEAHHTKPTSEEYTKLKALAAGIGWGQTEAQLGAKRSTIRSQCEHEARPIHNDCLRRLQEIDVDLVVKEVKERLQQRIPLHQQRPLRSPPGKVQTSKTPTREQMTETDRAHMLALVERIGWEGVTLQLRMPSATTLRHKATAPNPSMKKADLQRLRALQVESFSPIKRLARRFGMRATRPGQYDRTKPFPGGLVKANSPLIEAFINQAKSSTAVVRYDDLLGFARWMGVEEIAQAATHFIADKLRAHALTAQFIVHLQNLGRAPKTIQRRVSSLRQLVTQAQRMELCSWSLDVKGGSADTVKDTRGPSMAVVRQVLDHAKEKGPRDYAILRLFADLGLRVCEVADLHMEHVNLERSEIQILGKGRGARERLSLPAVTKAALQDWIVKRGQSPGPVWIGKTGRGMNTRSIYVVVRKIGRALGIKLWPHALRHSAITHALDVTNGDIRKVRQFSRHKSLDMLMVYDDARQDQAGALAELLSADPKKKKLTIKETLRLLREHLLEAKEMPERMSAKVDESLLLLGQVSI